MVSRASQQRLMLELHEALGSSLDLRGVIDAAFPLLARLIPVDCGALCVSSSSSVGGYDWATVDFPVDWFGDYVAMAPHDFVRSAVLARPNVVLRDSEMLSRKDLEANMMYQRACEKKMPLEQVMSVMLDLGTSWHAGINLYRGRRRPFSDAQRALLQQLTPSVGNAVRNCKLFTETSQRGNMVDSILRSKGIEVVVMSSGGTPTAFTNGAAALIARWFAPVELDRFGMPVELVERLSGIIRAHDSGVALPLTWTRTVLSGVILSVMFVRVPESAHKTVWSIVFQETDPMPSKWKDILTPKEVKIALRILLGWDNQLIADDMGCKLDTVKHHAGNIYDKLGVSSRTALCHLASQRG